MRIIKTICSTTVAILLGSILISASGCRRPAPADWSPTVRDEPQSFPAGTHLPPYSEVKASGAIDLQTFDPERDLIRFDDPRVWWESDHDNENAEDDHLIHKAVQAPLCRLIEQVWLKGVTLKVQDAYRPAGPHCKTSLHKEGRAIDFTCEGMPLEELAKLCWAVGFDWVYYEQNGGAHIHCSVRQGESTADAKSSL